jgi:hypothetical protein
MLSALTLGAAICIAALPPAEAQSDKKSEIKGGIESKIKSVDADAGKLTVTTADGKDRTFTVNDDTTIVGPRGGVVRRRLKDPRIHAGLEITVVAAGTTAKELHLGYDRKEKGAEDMSATEKAPTKGKVGAAEKAKKVEAKTEDKTATKGKSMEEEDDADEFPGKIKSADPDKRVLVITLLNGKDRSFLLASDVKLTVHGTASRKGLGDPAVKAGAAVTVVTDAGGRKVKEVQVEPAPASKRKKAG